MKIQNIRVITEDGLKLNSHLYGGNNRKIVLFVHGFETDFYSLPFISTIADRLVENNIDFISIQHRGTSQRMEFITESGEGKYIGSHMEVLEEAYLDIDAFVSWAIKNSYEEIYLAGHSLGTLKSVRYFTEGSYADKIQKLLLLAPFDKNGQEDVFTEGNWNKYLEQASKEIEAGNGRSYVPSYWEEVEMSYQTFYSWYRPSELGSMFDFYRKDYDFPVLSRIKIPTYIVVGTEDEFFHSTNIENPQEALDILLNSIPQSEGDLLEGCKHIYLGHEDQLADLLTKFCQK